MNPPEPWQMTRAQFRATLIKEKNLTREEYERTGGGVFAHQPSAKTLKQRRRLQTHYHPDAASRAGEIWMRAAKRLDAFDNDSSETNEHRLAVVKALAAGCDVPVEVLNDYPEIQEKS